jgi:pimeloyl-ACP methyl ester carboxylesterase
LAAATVDDPARPTLILVPGLLCDSLVWHETIAAFASTHDVVVPVLDGLDSIPAMAAQLLLDAPTTFALAGHSLGGRIALEVLRQAPERVAALALLDTGVHPCSPGEPQQRQVLLDIAVTQGMRAVARAWLPPMVHPARRSDPAFMAPLEAMIERRTPVTFRNQVAALLNRPDATPVLASIHCPTCVICGRQDEWSPPAQHQSMAASIAARRWPSSTTPGTWRRANARKAVVAELRRWLAPR